MANGPGEGHDLPADTHLPEWSADDFADPVAGRAIVALGASVDRLGGILTNAAKASADFALEGGKQREAIAKTLEQLNRRLDKEARASSGDIARGQAIDVAALERTVEQGIAQMMGIAEGMKSAHAHHATLLGAKPVSTAPDEKARKGFGLLADVHGLKQRRGRAMEWIKGLGAGLGVAVAVLEVIHKLGGH